MTRRGQSGFTLIEVVVAMVLLGMMMTLLYSGITFALRAWDAGGANGERVADRRIGENFLRREIAEMFPMRWKDPTALRYAFDGSSGALRFVSSRPAGVSQGGLALVGIDVEAEPGSGTRAVVMRRVSVDPDTGDFGSLADAEPTVLLPGVESISISYFGSENDFAEPKWVDDWTIPPRLPVAIRIRARGSDGAWLPDMLVKLMVGEEGGCFEAALQRGCRPRRM
jgi:general secretion pathway protein J